MDSSTYVEQVKQKTFYEYQNPDSLPQDLLQEWPTNQRLNGAMAIQLSSLACVFRCQRGSYAGMWDEDDLLGRVARLHGNVDGWRITQAIAAEGQKYAKEEAEEKKGFLAKLGFG